MHVFGMWGGSLTTQGEPTIILQIEKCLAPGESNLEPGVHNFEISKKLQSDLQQLVWKSLRRGCGFQIQYRGSNGVHAFIITSVNETRQTIHEGQIWTETEARTDAATCCLTHPYIQRCCNTECYEPDLAFQSERLKFLREKRIPSEGRI